MPTLIPVENKSNMVTLIPVNKQNEQEDKYKKQLLLNEINQSRPDTRGSLSKIADFFTGHFEKGNTVPEFDVSTGKVNVPGTADMGLQDPMIALAFGISGGVYKAGTLAPKIAKGATDAIGWLTGGATELPKMASGAVEGAAKAVEQKNLAGRMTKLREIGADVPVKMSGKDDINTAKVAIVDSISTKLQEAVANSDEKALQQADTLKKVHDSFGVTNAGEIPEGTKITLGKEIPNETKGQTGQIKGRQKERKVKKSGGGEQNQFTATDNINEQRKDIANKKDEIVKTASTEEEKRKLFAERLDAYKKKKELEAMEHYEEAPDPLSIDNSETQNTLFREKSSASSAPKTLKDVMDIGKKKELNVNASQSANGDLIVSVIDKNGNKADFPLHENGITMDDVHRYVGSWSEDFGKSMEKQYEIKQKVIDQSPELVRNVGKTKTHIIQQTGEKIEYQTVGDLRRQYEQRGLPWIKSKREYYAGKKIDEKAKTEIDEKMTPPHRTSLPEVELIDPKTMEQPGAWSWAEPFRYVAQEIERRTGFPMQQYESRIRDGMRQVTTSTWNYGKRLKEAKGGMGYDSAVRIYRALENPAFRNSNGSYTNFMKAVEQYKLQKTLGGFTKKEYDAATKIRSILNDAGEEFGIPLDKMLTDYAPRMMREGVASWEEAVHKWNLKEDFKWAAEFERTGYLRPHEENIFKVVDQYIRRGAKKRYIGNELEALTNEFNKLKLPGGENNPDAKQILGYISSMRGYDMAFDRTIRTSGEVLGKSLNKLINKALGMMHLEGSTRYDNAVYKRLEVRKRVIDPDTGKTSVKSIPKYFKESEAPGFFDTSKFAQDFIDLHLKLSYAGALAFRPMVYVRAAYQSLLSMPVTNPYWYARGMSKLTSPQAWSDAKAATALLQEAPIAAGEMSRGWNIIDDITQKSTYNLTSGHNVGRFIAYHAMHDKAEYYGGKYLDDIASGMTDEKALAKFIDQSGSDFFHPVLIKNEIVPLLKSGDIKSLSERMGLHMTAETQWLYEKAQSPYWARTMAGRVVGQFGIWPSWYLRYAKNLAMNGSGKNRAQRVAGLVAANALAIELGRHMFGVDVSSWMLQHPFMWSPTTSKIWDSVKDLAAGDDQKKSQAQSYLQNMAAIHIPGYLAVMDVMKGMKERKNEDVLKRYMGFKPSDPRHDPMIPKFAEKTMKSF